MMSHKNNRSTPIDVPADVTRRGLLQGFGAASLLGALAACGGDGDTSAARGSAESHGGPAPADGGVPGHPVPGTPGATQRRFAHPGLLHTEADFQRMRAKVAAGEQPWLDGWNRMLTSGRSHLNAWPRPLATVVRGGAGQNYAQMYIDIARAYQLALRWKISGDTQFADRAVVFLNAWSSTLTSIIGNADRFLAAGIYGYQFANAAEIMRSYEGWAAADLARFQQMMLNVFYPLNHHFLVAHNDAEITNYWANWDQANLASMLAIGVLCDRVDIYDEAVGYYKRGAGNGAGLQAVYHVHPGNLGQWQESSRDQGHCTLGIGLAAVFCEMAWNQGDDLYGYENNRFLAGAEYVAKSNLRDATGAFHAMPFLTYINKHGVASGVSPAGLGHLRGVWEIVHHHYAHRRGIAAPWSARQAAQLRPESDGGNGDQLGFGTLVFTRDAPPTVGRPTGLTARVRGSQVVLSWWGSTGAVSYTVKRSAQAGGPYTTLASGIVDLMSFTDTDVRAGQVWHYTVEAIGPAGDSHASEEARAALSPELLHRSAAVEVASALPGGLLERLADFSMCARVWLHSVDTWARVFDCGSGPRRFMMLTPRSNTGRVRFCITTVHGHNLQVIEGPAALPTGRWVHLAVTLSGTLGTLYVDGVAVGTHPLMTLAPCDLGEITQGWIGRSQFTADPLLNGRVEDLRVYSGALSAADVAALAGQ